MNSIEPKQSRVKFEFYDRKGNQLTEVGDVYGTYTEGDEGGRVEFPCSVPISLLQFVRLILIKDEESEALQPTVEPPVFV